MAWIGTTVPRRRFDGLFLGLFFLIMLAVTNAPQAALAQPGREGFGPRRPQFVVTAVNVHSIHETGPNWPGNDEVEVIMSDFTTAGVSTAFLWNVDAGETPAIPAAAQCIQPQDKCDHGVTNVHFRVALWENDEAPPPLANFCYGDIAPGNYWFTHGLCSGSDLIGKAEVTMSQQELTALIPTVGGSVQRTIKPTGGDGNYEFTFKITRLPDVGRDIVIGQPLEPAISLQASTKMLPAGKWEVTLTWTGATGNTVDIYRNGASLTSTANDGSHVDTVAAGTYSYRLCNAGSSTCSSDVSVTVQ